jgi:predicted TIM-barrel fold metal-dependent hydrolase
VFVECSAFFSKHRLKEFKAVGEVEFVQGIAAMVDSGLYGDCRACAAIIGRAQLSEPKIDAVLTEMMRCRNFRGIRVRDDKTMGSAAWKKGAALLEKHGLVMDFWTADVKQIPKLMEMAKLFPDLSIVLDHLGGLVGDNILSGDAKEQWKEDLRDIGAQCPNVFLKCGGIQMAANEWGIEYGKRERPIGSQELADMTFDWYSYAIDCFGADRCMFESNFPMDKVS